MREKRHVRKILVLEFSKYTSPKYFANILLKNSRIAAAKIDHSQILESCNCIPKQISLKLRHGKPSKSPVSSVEAPFLH